MKKILKFTMLSAILLMFAGGLVSCEKQNKNGDCTAEWEYGAKLKLKPQEDASYCPIEDPEIKALLLKHGLEMRRSWPVGANPENSELLLYYTLTIGEHRKCGKNYIYDFLSTGKFEDEVHFFEPVHPL